MNPGDNQKQSHLLRTYGISLDDWNRMFEEQNGCCMICKRHSMEISRKLVVDHCHRTMKVRALLCQSCNNILGRVNDDVFILKDFIHYLEKFS